MPQSPSRRAVLQKFLPAHLHVVLEEGHGKPERSDPTNRAITVSHAVSLSPANGFSPDQRSSATIASKTTTPNTATWSSAIQHLTDARHQDALQILKQKHETAEKLWQQKVDLSEKREREKDNLLQDTRRELNQLKLGEKQDGNALQAKIRDLESKLKASEKRVSQTNAQIAVLKEKLALSEAEGHKTREQLLEEREAHSKTIAVLEKTAKEKEMVLERDIASDENEKLGKAGKYVQKKVPQNIESTSEDKAPPFQIKENDVDAKSAIQNRKCNTSEEDELEVYSKSSKRRAEGDEKELHELRERCKESEEKLTNCLQVYETTEKERIELESKLTNCLQAYETSEKEHASAENRVVQLEADLEEAHRNMKGTKKAAAMAHKLLSTSEAELLKALENDHAEAEEDAAALEKEVKSLKEQLQEIRFESHRQIESYKTRVLSLEEDLTTAAVHFDEYQKSSSKKLREQEMEWSMHTDVLLKV